MKKSLILLVFFLIATAMSAETILSVGVPFDSFFVDYQEDADHDVLNDIVLSSGIGVKLHYGTDNPKWGYFGSLWTLFPFYSEQFENDRLTLFDMGLSLSAGFDYKVFETEKQLLFLGMGGKYSVRRLGDSEYYENFSTFGLILQGDYYLHIGRYYYLVLSVTGSLNVAGDYDFVDVDNKNRQQDIDYRTAVPSWSIMPSVSFGILL